MVRTRLVVGSLVLGALVWGSLALALTPNPACVKSARHDKRDCLKTCQEDFQIDKDECLDVDHDCAEACRAAFHNCRQPVVDCITVCNDQLRANIANCPPAGDPGRDACIDGFQIQAFICRDGCREQFHDQVKACKAARRDCVKNCPPPPTPTPTPVP